MDPNEPRPHHWLGIEYAKAGYLEKARQQLQIAADLEPDHANANGYLGFVLMLQGDFERARFHVGEQVRLGNVFGGPRLVYIDILTGDLLKARQAAVETDGIDTETRARLALLIDAIEDPSATSQYLEQIKQSDLDRWHINQELFLLGLYSESMRLYENDASLLMSWADYWSEARALPEFEQILEAKNVFPVWDALGPPPMCRKTGQSYDCRKGL
jgi:tetratricopeptide (TPR) repeat protein